MHTSHVSLTRERIVSASRQLPRAQLAELVDILTFELHEEIDPDIETAWADVAERRLTEIRKGQVQALPGEQVLAELRKRVGG